MGQRRFKNLKRYMIPVLTLSVLLMASVPAAGTQYDGTVPPAEDALPGAYVRYVELERDDRVDWSWKSTGELDFEISIPSENESVRKKIDSDSQGGHLLVERSGVYRFAWYNDDQGVAVDIDYTIHQIQSDAWVLGLAVIGVMAVIVIGYVLWYHRRRTETLGEALQDMMEESAQTPKGGNLATNRMILAGFVAGLVAISAISWIFIQQEDLEVTRGSELVVTVDNTANASRSATVTVMGPADQVVQEDSLELATGQTGHVIVLASPEWGGVPLTVKVDDGTGGSTSDQVWTPTSGQGDVLAFVLE
jgi:hypothetical protein